MASFEIHYIKLTLNTFYFINVMYKDYAIYYYQPS